MIRRDDGIYEMRGNRELVCPRSGKYDIAVYPAYADCTCKAWISGVYWDGEEDMKIDQNKVFSGMGFERLELTAPFGIIVCFRSPKTGKCFRIDHFAGMYVDEVAGDIDAAGLNMFEDGFLFDDSLPEEELIQQIREGIRRDDV